MLRLPVLVSDLSVRVSHPEEAELTMVPEAEADRRDPLRLRDVEERRFNRREMPEM